MSLDLLAMQRRTAAIKRAIATAVRELIASKGAASRSDVLAAVCARRKDNDPAEIEQLVDERFRSWRFGFGGRFTPGAPRR